MSVILKASKIDWFINPLNAELNPTCHLLALLGAHPILHISRIRVKPEHFGKKHSTVPDAIPGTFEIKGLLDSVMYWTLENYVYYISQWGDLTI